MRLTLYFLDEIKKLHQDFRVYIGVAGATGAGKTSALNAVLGMRNLLPSSNEAASTAVVCQVAYNEDDDQKRAFRAEVIFKSLRDYREELEVFFDDLRLSQMPDDDDYGDGDIYSAQDKKAMADNIKQSAGKIKAVFGLDERHLINQTVDSLLARNSDVLAMFGKTMTIVECDAESFSRKVKPYLDSTSTNHGDTGFQFAAWPLIEEVRIFVKADILKNGLVLVDLPGLADSDEGRAAVAERYFSQLTVTAIVSPIIRATDEQTGQKLLSTNQELAMQMDGKFDRKGFCVVLSQMDQMEPHSFMRNHDQEYRDDLEFHRAMQRLSILNDEYRENQEKLKAAEISVKLMRKKRNAAKNQHQDAQNRGSPP